MAGGDVHDPGGRAVVGGGGDVMPMPAEAGEPSTSGGRALAPSGPPSSTPAAAAGAAGLPYSQVARTGYLGFGSFFTDSSVEEMVAVPAERYVPPPRPVPLPPSLDALGPATPLGRPCRALFLVDFAEWTFINHGAFGAVCRPAHEEAAAWREHCEAQPLRFLDRW